jgi:hypothetical protein
MHGLEAVGELAVKGWVMQGYFRSPARPAAR